MPPLTKLFMTLTLKRRGANGASLYSSPFLPLPPKKENPFEVCKVSS